MIIPKVSPGELGGSWGSCRPFHESAKLLLFTELCLQEVEFLHTFIQTYLVTEYRSRQHTHVSHQLTEYRSRCHTPLTPVQVHRTENFPLLTVLSFLFCFVFHSEILTVFQQKCYVQFNGFINIKYYFNCYYGKHHQLYPHIQALWSPHGIKSVAEGQSAGSARALAALTKDTSSVPSTHVMRLIIAWNSSSRESDAPFWPLWHCTHRGIHTQTHIYYINF